MPIVSVIVPNYNHAAYLEQRIGSVLNQTERNFELIILDDYSTDNSREVIDKFRGTSKLTHVVYNEANSGSTFKQWKKGVDLAQGDWIWIAESDDYADLHFLEKLLAKAKANSSIGLVYCQSWVVDAQGEKMNLVSDWISGIGQHRWESDFHNDGMLECANYMITQNLIFNASAVIFKKELFLKAFEVSTLKLTGDWLLWVKILMQCDMSYVAAPLNYFRWHDKNVRSNFSNQLTELKECIYVIERIRNTAQENADSVRLAYIIAVNRVLGRVKQHKALPKEKFEIYISKELEDIAVSAELKNAIELFVENSFKKTSRLSAFSSLIKSLYR